MTGYRLLRGYDYETDREYLVTIWASGLVEVATRPGNLQTSIAWSAPLWLTEERCSPC